MHMIYYDCQLQSYVPCKQAYFKLACFKVFIIYKNIEVYNESDWSHMIKVSIFWSLILNNTYGYILRHNWRPMWKLLHFFFFSLPMGWPNLGNIGEKLSPFVSVPYSSSNWYRLYFVFTPACRYLEHKFTRSSATNPYSIDASRWNRLRTRPLKKFFQWNTSTKMFQTPKFNFIY